MIRATRIFGGPVDWLSTYHALSAGVQLIYTQWTIKKRDISDYNFG